MADALSFYRRSSLTRFAPAAALAIAFIIAYWQTYVTLATGPWQSEQEGHGPLIVLAVVWLVWRDRRAIVGLPAASAPLSGWVALGFGLATMALTRSQGLLVIEVASQVPTLLGCLLLFGGWPLAKRLGFALTFFLFSAPPPLWALDALTVPLKVWVSDLVANGLYDLGLPIAQNGVEIMIGPYSLMVKDACSGMNSIFALSAIGVFYIHEFVDRNWLRRILLALAIVPIAIAANVVRVAALVVAAYQFGPDLVDAYVHPVMGVALFVVAMALFFLADGLIVFVGAVALRRR
jgi:exosortase